MVVVSIVLGTVLYCIMVAVVSDVAAHCVYISCVILESAWTMMTVCPTAPTASVVSTWTGHQAPRAHCMYKYNVQLWHAVS